MRRIIPIFRLFVNRQSTLVLLVSLRSNKIEDETIIPSSKSITSPHQSARSANGQGHRALVGMGHPNNTGG